jgi:hypothetical protein
MSKSLENKALARPKAIKQLFDLKEYRDCHF